jgi:hypothetical protein
MEGAAAGRGIAVSTAHRRDHDDRGAEQESWRAVSGSGYLRLRYHVEKIIGSQHSSVLSLKIYVLQQVA